ncbi:hypothetical protein [Flavobacterium pedocola]
MNYQEMLLKEVRKHLSEDQSIIDTLAGVLNISYDAAHRRVSLKSKFSIEETAVLCTHYSISMDNLFAGKNRVVLNKTSAIKGIEDFETYFKQSAEFLFKHKDSGSVLYYSAKDIPLFYTIGGTLLSKFKIYIWTQLLNGEEDQLSFEQFKLDSGLLEQTSKLKSVYESSKVIELWNDTTINSTLQQIFYFFEAGLVSFDTAMLLLEDVTKVIQTVEAKTSKNDSRYQLFYNELLILNNNVLLTNQKEKSLFVPYNMLGYFITENSETCTEVESFFKNQLLNSKLLQTTGKRDRNLFFNKMYQKIEFYSNRVKSFVNE